MNQLANPQHCLLMRSGIQIWLDEDKAMRMADVLANIGDSHKFVRIYPDKPKTVNTADLSGLYDAEEMEGLANRKGGKWQCKGGKWHNREEQNCDHPSLENVARTEKINNCKECKGKGAIEMQRESTDSDGNQYPEFYMKRCECTYA